MDLNKAQRLLHKIEAFLDNGNAHELSRLEKDLIKSYVIQLYEAVTDDAAVTTHEQEKPIEFVEHKMPKREAPPKIEIQPSKESDLQKHETPKQPPVFQETYMPKEKPVEVEIPYEEPKRNPTETKINQANITEPVKEPVISARSNQPVSTETNEALNKLFELPKIDEMSGRFSHVPIASIESAMGLNERIFTLNELFGGDKTLFDATCTKLNHLHSFAEAKALLIAGPAKDYQWSEPKRIKMAEQFIRIVARRYPKSVS